MLGQLLNQYVCEFYTTETVGYFLRVLQMLTLECGATPVEELPLKE